MKLFRSMDHLPPGLRGGAVSIGNFDGVHRGHAQIVERLLSQARQVSGPAVVFTFDPHPVRLLRPDSAPPPLTWTDRKAELLDELGVDAVIAYPTDDALLRLEYGEFFDRIVRGQLEARAIVEGPNFYFGRHRRGTVEVLRRLCDQHAIFLEVVPPLTSGGDYISSSRVRSAVREGEVAEARDLLTRPYRIRGMVTHGAARGARIGFPTANIDAIDTLLPAYGVYAGRAFVLGEFFPAAVNIGPNPTFDERGLKVEAHLLDFDGSLYGQPIEVDFLARVREIQKFGTVEDLKEQLHRDITKVRELFRRTP